MAVECLDFRNQRRIGTIAITVAALVGVSLSGCFGDLLGHPLSLYANWYQPETWDDFPQEREVGDFWITLENGTSGGGRLAVKQGSLSSEYSRIVVSVGTDGRVSYSYFDRQPSWSSDAAWKHLHKTFETLGLPDPTLDLEFQFAHDVFRKQADWEQSGVWSGFPESEVAGFKIITLDNYKIAERIESATSEFVRVTHEGEVMFRYEKRFIKGTTLPDLPYEESIAEPPHATFTDETVARLLQAFEELGLPEPRLHRDQIEDEWR